jgi:hypothetical protein
MIEGEGDSVKSLTFGKCGRFRGAGIKGRGMLQADYNQATRKTLFKALC